MLTLPISIQVLFAKKFIGYHTQQPLILILSYLLFAKDAQNFLFLLYFRLQKESHSL